MPTFKWDDPNIRALEGAIWQAHHAILQPPSDPDGWERELGPWQEGGLAADGCKPATAWKMPSGPGEAFYRYLRKHYLKGPTGDYSESI